MGLFKRRRKQQAAGGTKPVSLESKDCSPSTQDGGARDGLPGTVGSSSAPRVDGQDAQVPPDPGSLWDQAYEALKKDNAELIDKYNALLSKEAQSQAASQSDQRSRQAQLDAVIEHGLRRMEETGSKVEDTLAQASKLILWAKDWVGEAVKASPEASMAWSGVCLVLPLLTNAKTASEANEDGFTYVTSRMRYYVALEPLLQRLGRDPTVSKALMSEANSSITSLYQHIIEFQVRSALRYCGTRLVRYAKDVVKPEVWKELKAKIDGLEKTANGNLAQINELAARGHLGSLDEAARESFRQMQHLVSINERQLSTAQEHRDISQKQVNILEAVAKQTLSAASYKVLQLFRLSDGNRDVSYEWYKNRIDDRVEGTCEWFQSHEHYQDWLRQKSGPLLVSADPGCGKSVLAKYLVDSALPRSATICYFFFKDNDQNTIRQALCALLHQLFIHKPELINHAQKQYDIDGENLISTTQSLWNVLAKATRDPQAGSVILVLDALDECMTEQFKYLVKRIEDISLKDDKTSWSLKWLLTTRPYDQILSEFTNLRDAFPCIHVPGEEKSDEISREIDRVIVYRTNKLAKTKTLSPELREDLQKTLREIPHRTYLWVHLVFEYLAKALFKKTADGIRAAIKTLPRSVRDAYEQILSRSENAPDVRKALSIVLAAARPLSLSEMNVAMGISMELESLQSLSLEDDADFKDRLRSMCGLFLSIHQKHVYFIHQTAREFLLATSSKHRVSQSSLVWEHSVSLRDAHAVLAEVCVRFLDLSSPERTVAVIRRKMAARRPELRDLYVSADENIDDNIDQLLSYALPSWAEHLRKAKAAKDARIIDAACRVCSVHSTIYVPWHCYEHLPKYSLDKWRCTALIAASHFGLVTLMKRFLADKHYIDARNNYTHETALFLAIRAKQRRATKLLVHEGADLEARDSRGETPLCIAAQHGYTEIVGLLLVRADTEVRNINGDTVLLAAIRSGNTETARLLLERSDIEARSDHGETALRLAAWRGNTEFVRMLLGRADIEARDKNGDTPLLAAVQRGNSAAVRLLLRRADIEARDKNGNTPLLAAARWGEIEVVRLLISQGAEINARSFDGKTALSYAAYWGYADAVELLIDAGANINMPGRDECTPLISAIKEGYREVVQLLLSKGARVDVGKMDGWTMLCRAAVSGNADAVARVLVEEGAEDIDEPGIGAWTPLTLATWLGHGDVIQVLVNNGASINSGHGRRMTALCQAALDNSADTARLLLDLGAEIDEPDEYGWTPLAVAVALDAPFEDIRDVLQLLVSRGANVERARIEPAADTWMSARPRPESTSRRRATGEIVWGNLRRGKWFKYGKWRAWPKDRRQSF